MRTAGIAASADGYIQDMQGNRAGSRLLIAGAFLPDVHRLFRHLADEAEGYQEAPCLPTGKAVGQDPASQIPRGVAINLNNFIPH